MSRRPENEKLPTNIRRAPGGRSGYQVRYYDSDGKRRTKTCESLAGARAFQKNVEADVQRDEWIAPEAGRTLFGEYAEYVESITRRRRANTKERDELVLRSRLLPRWGDWSLGRIKRVNVQAWVDELIDEGLAPATIHKRFRLFARVLDEAVDDQLISASPCRKIQLPEIVVHERFALEPEHVQALADAVPNRYRALILTTAAAGLRWGEAVGLKVGRIDMLRREIDIAETLVEFSNGTFIFGPPKTKKSRARVSFPSGLTAALAHHLDEYGPRTKRGVLDRDGLAFTNTDGGYLRRSNFRRRIWLPTLEAIGLPRDVHFHDLRGFTASLLIDANATPLDVSQKLRHAKPSITLDRYAHRFGRAAERTDAMLDEGLFGGSWGTGGVQANR